MKRFYPIFLITVYIFLSGCYSVKTIRDSQYKNILLSETIATSPLDDFTVQVPFNWFNTKDPEVLTNSIWLVHDNYSGVISIQKITQLNKLHGDTRSTLLQLAKADLVLQKRKHPHNFRIVIPQKLYKNNKIIYSAYEFIYDDEKYSRVIIRELNGDFFKLVAYTTKLGSNEFSLLELFSAQESVCLSLRKN